MFDPTENPDLAILQAGNQQGDINTPPDGGIPPEQQPHSETTDTTEEDGEIDKLLLALMEKAEQEDIDLRYRLLNTTKRNDCYFNNIQAIFFDTEAQDYRTVDSILAKLGEQLAGDDIKIINIYRPLVESIVTALSVQPPNITYMPDDAESPEDLETCKAYDKITDLIQRHNHAQIMLIKFFILLVNGGVVAGHNYYKTDPAYGVSESPSKTEPKEIRVADIRCPQCSQLIDSNLPTTTIAEGSQISCPTCGYQGPPTIYQRVEYEDEVTEWDKTPKGRSGFELFGPESVKMPLYSTKQSKLPYLILRIDDNVAQFRTIFDNYDISSGGGDTQLYERWARIPVEYNGTIPINVTTCRYGWFRPWYYAELGKDDAKKLQAKYPNGVKIAVIDKLLLEQEAANLDDEWTITFDPRSKFIHAEPHGNAIIPVQDSKTDIFNLGLQSIEYGIPETFVHPKTINLEHYKKQAKAPGMMTRALPPGPDKSLGDGFYQVKTATLSNEYTTFDKNLDSIGQFVSGAMPAIWGGAVKTGETTATETTSQKAQALQRLQLMWHMASVFWCSMLHKCTKDFAQNMREDEKYTMRKNGSYVNVWIRKTSLNGRVGSAEPDLNGSIPQSWEQKKDFVMSLIQMQNPEVGTILLHPNNSELLKESTGMQDMYIPGEKDRDKQYAEFYELVLAESPDGGMTPSVEIDIDVDDHDVHMKVLKNILVSEIGMALYKENPGAYANCIAHYRHHQMAIQAHTTAPSGLTAPGEVPESATAATHG